MRQPLPKYQITANSQRGAALIVVLLFLILIVFVGVISVKRSVTDLKVATSDQINTLLLQSSDKAIQNIEQSVNGNVDSDIHKEMLSRTGPFGHFILDQNSADHEYIFCFRPRDRFFNINRTSIVTADGSSILSGGNGYCNPKDAKDYISARNTSMTQINITMPTPDPNNEPFASFTIGKDSSEISSQAFMFDITSTAVLPSYASTKLNSNSCFEKTSRIDNSDTIDKCMANAGVPSTVLYEQVNVENLSEGTVCVPFGAGNSSSGALSDKCVVLLK